MIGLVVVAVLVVGLFAVRNFGRRILDRAAVSRRAWSSSTTGSRRACSRSIAFRAAAHRRGDRCSSGRPRRCASTWSSSAFGFRRPARHQRRVLRGPHRLAADGGAVQPGRSRHRGGRHRRRPDRGLRRAAGRGDGDRAGRSRHQRVLDHRVRLDRLPGVLEAARPARGRSTGRADAPPEGSAGPGPGSAARAFRGRGGRPRPYRGPGSRCRRSQLDPAGPHRTGPGMGAGSWPVGTNG